MTDASRLCRNLQQEMGALFTCSEQDGRQRIRTPYLYPDGDCIDLYLQDRRRRGDGERSCRAERLAGRSGRGWTVDFHVRTARRSSLVQVLSTGSRAAAHRVSEHVLAAWHDLNHLAAGPEALTFVSLFDDAADVWADEDFRLVEPLSTVSHWSRPDEFAAVLRDAA